MLIIEILEHQMDVTNSDACAYFLKDLADSHDEVSSSHIVESSHVIVSLQHHNDDTSNDNNDEMEKMTWFPNLSIPASSSSLKETKCCACIARGSQKLVGSATNKNNNDVTTSHWMNVEICVLRLPTVQTDLLITLSTPSPQHEQIIVLNDKPTTVQKSEAKEDGTGDSISDDDHQYYLGDTFQQILKTLNIIDWSLFLASG